MKEKYKDQDEEDRELIMKLLAVSNILNYFSCFSVGIQAMINIKNLVQGQPGLQELVPGQAPKLQRNPISKKKKKEKNYIGPVGPRRG